MKTLILTFVLLLNLQNAFAATFTATCVSPKGKAGGDTIIGDEETGAKFKLMMSGSTFKTDIAVYKGKVTGTFVKVAKNELYLFSAPGLNEFVDQSDYTYVYISKELMSGRSGKLSFSVRQLGDSEGSWWLNQYFNCSVQPKI